MIAGPGCEERRVREVRQDLPTGTFNTATQYLTDALASAQQKLPGGIVAFDVAGGRDAAWRVIDATRMLSITANLGDTKTTITHPASTTHGRLTPEERAAAGIGEGLVRVAAGLEAFEDIRDDLASGLRE